MRKLGISLPYAYRKRKITYPLWKSSFKAEKLPVSQKLHYWWQKNGSFMTKFTVKGSGLTRISIAYSKSRASWKKSYAVCEVGSPQNNIFWVFKLWSDTQCRLIHSTAAMCTWKSSKRTAPHTLREEILCFFMIMQSHIQQESRRNKYWI